MEARIQITFQVLLMTSSQLFALLLLCVQDANEFLLYGGWIPFTETFNDSHRCVLKA